MYNHLIWNNRIAKNQSGFRPDDSVTNQIIFSVDKIHSSLDINLEVRLVFLGMPKACDKIWHEGQPFKLRQNGINGKLINLLKSYLSNRKQRILINGSEYDWGQIEFGVPQGSVLGPLLFFFYLYKWFRNRWQISYKILRWWYIPVLLFVILILQLTNWTMI